MKQLTLKQNAHRFATNRNKYSVIQVLILPFTMKRFVTSTAGNSARGRNKHNCLVNNRYPPLLCPALLLSEFTSIKFWERIVFCASKLNLKLSRIAHGVGSHSTLHESCQIMTLFHFYCILVLKILMLYAPLR